MQIYTIQFDFNNNLNTEVPLSDNVFNGHNKSCFIDTIKILLKIYLSHVYTTL